MLRSALLVLVLSAGLVACGAPSSLGGFPAPTDAALAAIDSLGLRSVTAELSSDGFEGRGTGTAGEEKTVALVIDRLRALGVEGGMPDGSFRQAVPLRSVRLAELTRSVSFVPERSMPGKPRLGVLPAFGDEIIVSTVSTQEAVDLNDVPLVFVGYGITNPGYDWDDYKGADVRGKVIVSFVNDPPATPAEPDLFQADTLTYNGRWTYKYEEARRQGARGMLLIHTDETAGYPFTVLNGDAFGEHYTGVDAPDGALDVRGWMAESVARRLAELSGSSLDDWFSMAARRDFQPVELPLTVSGGFRFEQREGVVGTNVVGVIRGSEAPGEAVVYGAHHDHLGIDREAIARGEDGIYNGAIDNATGVAMMLELAEAFAALPEPPRRSVYFVTFSAEESGLLGSAYFADNPPVPLSQMVANVNVDSGNLGGRTRDIVGIGAERSDLLGLLREAAAAEGMTVSPDAAPNQGIFYRSDQLAFARGGVPAVFLNTGTQFVGQPADYAARLRAAYIADKYHKPGDEFDPAAPYGGLVQQTRVAFRLGYALAASDLSPEWRPSEAFAETRRLSRER